MEGKKQQSLNRGQGSNSKSIRSHNEKAVLHILRYLKRASRNQLAEYMKLTSQSLAMITGSLEKKRLIVNVGKQIKGLGQPSFLYRLNSEGVYSIGFNIGRKTLDMLLINFAGEECIRRFLDYPFPEENVVIKEIKNFIALCKREVTSWEDSRFAGIGVGIPSFLGSWEGEFPKQADLWEWDQERFQLGLERELNCKVYFENDMNAASMAAMIRGNGNRLQNFIYLYLGTFVGGGVVLDRKIIKGEGNNAGNFGTLLIDVPPTSPIYNPRLAHPCQLLSYVSINHLKKFLSKRGLRIPERNRDFFHLLEHPTAKIEKWLGTWLEEVARLLSQAILFSNSVLDFRHVIFDSSLNPRLVERLCGLIAESFSRFDTTGLFVPQVIQGDLGVNARALGSAMIPIYEQYVPIGSSVARDSQHCLRRKIDTK